VRDELRQRPQACGVVVANGSNRAASESQTGQSSSGADDACDRLDAMSRQRDAPDRRRNLQNRVHHECGGNAHGAARRDRAQNGADCRAAQALRERNPRSSIAWDDGHIQSMAEPTTVPHQCATALADRPEARGSIANDVDETVEVTRVDLAVDVGRDDDVEWHTGP